MIVTLNKNTVVRLYYSQSLASNDIAFDIWDDTGAQLVADATATELSDSGIFYYDFTTPDEDVYILVKAGDGGSDEAGQVYQVGNPLDKKVFYINNNFTSNEAINYTIFDLENNIVKSGFLQEINGSGFYYVSVSDIETEEELFFQAEGFISNFFVETGTVISGDADFVIESSYTASPAILYIGKQFISIQSSYSGEATVISEPDLSEPSVPEIPSVPVANPFGSRTSATVGDKNTNPSYRTPNTTIVNRARNTISTLTGQQALVLKAQQAAAATVANNGPISLTSGQRTRTVVAGSVARVVRGGSGTKKITVKK